MYTITVIVAVLLLLLSPHRPSVIGNMSIDIFTEFNNKVIEQLTPGLRKLMEKTAFVFWVDLGYRLRSRLRVPL